MTQSLTPRPAAYPTARSTPSGTRRLLRAVTIAACLPYLTLKIVWVAGGHLGIPAGSPLLEHPTAMVAANLLTVLMDGAVIVLALLLTRPWGLRVPAWLLVPPLWAASGLLAPIMTGYPLQMLVRAFGGSAGGTSGGSDEPFLREWVFVLVYAGFIVQGLALGALGLLYARDRWGHVWRGRTGDLPAGLMGTRHRTAAVAAAVVALFPLALRLLWACGGTTGLSESQIAGRSSDFHVLESLYVVFLLVAVTGGWLLAFRRCPGLPVRVPLALAWTGSGAVACWGGWMALAVLVADDPADRPASLTLLTYAGQMIVGILVATVAVRHARSLSAPAARRRPGP
ncbi:hypothetical protein L1856_14835 [Streptomyces sp. Tue 6430]|nr:hypothetical protein [Streptomyces sp. Tue 6430]